MKVKKTPVAMARVGLTAALVAGGATVGVFASPTAQGDIGVVQQAQAATIKAKVKKAKAAYNAFMATKGWRWGTSPAVGKRVQSSFSFALVDINGDGVPELIDYYTTAPWSTYRARVYTYRDGNVSYAGKLWREGPSKVYRKGHLLYHRYVSGGAVEIAHYKMVGGKLKKAALASGTCFDPDPSLPVKHMGSFRGMTVNYQVLRINGKSVSWSAYKSGLKQLRKNSTKTVKIKYHTNTATNRAKYL